MTGEDSLLDLGALAPDVLHDEPYRWARLRNAIRPRHADALRRTFPRTGFWELRKHDGEKYMRFLLRPLVPLGAGRAALAESLDPPWQALVTELLAPAYRESCERALGRSLDQAGLEISAWRWDAEAELGPHVDIPRKIASQVFYFNDRWDPAWGGCLRILRSADEQDVYAELPPDLGSASLIVRSESSWHAVPRVRTEAAAQRLSVIATWQHPGTESPFWTIESDGSIRCHTTGSVPADDQPLPAIA
jgi:2OG-Fe(II) oxygenase superfamily